MATQQDIAYHYDVNNDFYALFLDSAHRVYSCAVWENASTLEQAQTHKLDRICRYADLQPGDHIMDVGCGWGGLMKHAISDFGAVSAFGLTLSDDQFEFVSANADNRVSIALQPWQQYKPEGKKYDAIVSVGAFEHFASLKDRAAKKQQEIYREFFDWCRSISTSQAQIGLQTIITPRKPANITELRDTRYLLKHVFPGTASPTIEDIKSSIVGRYEILEQKNIGSDYVRTLDAWQARLRENKSIIISNFSQELYDHYDRYFTMAARGFESGLLDLVQISLKRI